MTASKKTSPTDRVIHEGKNGVGIILAIVGLVILLPSLLGAGLGIAADSADQLTKPIPGNAKRLNDQAQQTTPTTAAPQMTDKELQARMQAKQLGDGLAAARIAPAAPPEDGGYWPRLGEAPSGGLLGELPVVGGTIQGALKALGPGGTKALNP